MSEYEKLLLRERLCKSIGNLLFCWDKLELDGSIFNLFLLVMSLNVDILAGGMRFKIFGKNDCALVIAVNDQCTEGKLYVLG